MLTILLHLSLLICPSIGFFFPMGGGGCQCIPCPSPVICTRPPTCAIPLPCPSPGSYAQPSAYNTQGYLKNGVAARYELASPSPVPIPSKQTVPVPYQPSTYQIVQPSYRTVETAYQLPRPAYHTSEVAYQTESPLSSTGYTATHSNPVILIEPVQTVATSELYRENSKEDDDYPTLIPTPTQTTKDYYNSDSNLNAAGGSYDYTKPALAPPAPSASTESHTSSIEYGSESSSVQDKEAHLEPDTDVKQYFDEEDSVEQKSTPESSQSPNTGDSYGSVEVHSGATTEGVTPVLKFYKRHWALKRLRKARQFSATVPRTNTTCNSQKLASVMDKAMVEDVSRSKRAILGASEMAFDSEKFDVFCAMGEFSYSIHSRKYCEVTKNEVTCFAFR